MLEEGTFRYAVKDAKGQRKLVTLSGATVTDPLKGVAHCSLLIRDNNIVGIHLNDNCVVKKQQQVLQNGK